MGWKESERVSVECVGEKNIERVNIGEKITTMLSSLSTSERKTMINENLKLELDLLVDRKIFRFFDVKVISIQSLLIPTLADVPYDNVI